MERNQQLQPLVVTDRHYEVIRRAHCAPGTRRVTVEREPLLAVPTFPHPQRLVAGGRDNKFPLRTHGTAHEIRRMTVEGEAFCWAARPTQKCVLQDVQGVVAEIAGSALRAYGNHLHIAPGARYFLVRLSRRPGRGSASH